MAILQYIIDNISEDICIPSKQIRSLFALALTCSCGYNYHIAAFYVTVAACGNFNGTDKADAVVHIHGIALRLIAVYIYQNDFRNQRTQHNGICYGCADVSGTHNSYFSFEHTTITSVCVCCILCLKTVYLYVLNDNYIGSFTV